MKMELYLSLLGIELGTAKLDIYYKKKKIFTEVDEETQEFMKQKLDLAFEVRFIY